jgi:hypothetical protein
MPYTLRKMPGKNCYRVSKKAGTTRRGKTSAKRRVFSKCTTRKNALSQLRLLRALQYNKSFVPRKQSP